MEKRVLYLTNVPWGWIKQRPHFLAEYLSKDFEVTVFQQHYLVNPFKKSVLVADRVEETDTFHVKEYFLLPHKKFIPKFLITHINNLIVRLLSLRLSHHYDVIWFASAMVYNRFKFLAHRGNSIIYDCMDDYLEFPETKSNIKKASLIKIEEEELLKRATLTIFSADYLRKKVFSRYELSVPYIIVNNAIEIPKYDAKVISKHCEVISKLQKPFVYIGTVSEWFDFSLVLRVLDNNKDVNFVIVGPKLVPIPIHPRLHYLEPVDHDQVFSIINSSYVLVMPFVVNELIKSVNPVKLYEYIYSGKPVIAARYEETEKFRDFVYLYSDFNEFNQIVDIINNETRTPDYIKQCKMFAENNTWAKRCEIVNNAIKELDN